MHGSLYDYFRTNLLDANDWFGEQREPLLRPGSALSTERFRRNFGRAAHSAEDLRWSRQDVLLPSYEGLQLAQQTPQTFQYTPAMEVIDSAPSASTPIWAAFPSASEPEIKDASGAGTGLAPIYFRIYSLPSHVNSTSIRLDHTLSPKLVLFARFGDTPSTSQSRQLWSFTTDQNHVETFTVGATSQLAKTRARLAFWITSQSKSILDTRTEGYPFESDTVPISIQVSGYLLGKRRCLCPYRRSRACTESRTDHLASTFAQWNLRDTFDIEVGSHHVKLGIDQRHIDATVVLLLFQWRPSFLIAAQW